jgi:hypothetical protein
LRCSWLATLAKSRLAAFPKRSYNRRGEAVLARQELNRAVKEWVMADRPAPEKAGVIHSPGVSNKPSGQSLGWRLRLRWRYADQHSGTLELSLPGGLLIGSAAECDIRLSGSPRWPQLSSPNLPGCSYADSTPTGRPTARRIRFPTAWSKAITQTAGNSSQFRPVR